MKTHSLYSGFAGVAKFNELMFDRANAYEADQRDAVSSTRNTIVAHIESAKMMPDLVGTRLLVLLAALSEAKTW